MACGAVRSTTVLVVEDQERLLALYERTLSERYDVVTAATADGAMDALDDDPDVALLDRRLPDGHGDDVLEAIQARDLDCRVAMVTAVDPDFGIIDMGCDDYLVKPLSASEIEAAVERLRKLDRYDRLQRQLSEKRIKRNVLASEKCRSTLENSPEFARLQEEIEELEAELESVESEIEELPVVQ